MLPLLYLLQCRLPMMSNGSQWENPLCQHNCLLPVSVHKGCKVTTLHSSFHISGGVAMYIAETGGVASIFVFPFISCLCSDERGCCGLDITSFVKLHVCVCVCVMGGQRKSFDPESNTGTSLD